MKILLAVQDIFRILLINKYFFVTIKKYFSAGQQIECVSDSRDTAADHRGPDVPAHAALPSLQVPAILISSYLLLSSYLLPIIHCSLSSHAIMLVSASPPVAKLSSLQHMTGPGTGLGTAVGRCPHCSTASPHCDVYSLGLVLHELCSGES